MTAYSECLLLIPLFHSGGLKLNGQCQWTQDSSLSYRKQIIKLNGGLNENLPSSCHIYQICFPKERSWSSSQWTLPASGRKRRTRAARCSCLNLAVMKSGLHIAGAHPDIHAFKMQIALQLFGFSGGYEKTLNGIFHNIIFSLTVSTALITSNSVYVFKNMHCFTPLCALVVNYNIHTLLLNIISWKWNILLRVTQIQTQIQNLSTCGEMMDHFPPAWLAQFNTIVHLKTIPKHLINNHHKRHVALQARALCRQ